MNKTINELVALTELANDDELIVYDVSEGTSKMIKKSDFVTTSIASGNLKPPTSNAVFNALGGKVNLLNFNALTGMTLAQIFSTYANQNTAMYVGFVEWSDARAPEPNTCFIFAGDWMMKAITIYGDSYYFNSNTNAWVRDVPISNGEVTFNANVTGGRIQWCRKGNVVTLDVEVLELAQWTDGDRQISTSQLPIPLVENVHFAIPPLNGATPSQAFEIDSNGYLKVNGGRSQAGQFLGGFTYLCKN